MITKQLLSQLQNCPALKLISQFCTLGVYVVPGCKTNLISLKSFQTCRHAYLYSISSFIFIPIGPCNTQIFSAHFIRKLFLLSHSTCINDNAYNYYLSFAPLMGSIFLYTYVCSYDLVKLIMSSGGILPVSMVVFSLKQITCS